MSGGRRGFALPAAVYPIVDVGTPSRFAPLDLARILFRAGAPLLQLRAKATPTRDFCDLARAIQDVAATHAARLILNDRADIARLVGAAGVHLGQTDLHPDDARRILGPNAIVGFSTHNESQVGEADALDSVDYIGFGPIFPTASKANPDPCQGLEGLRRVRRLTSLPIVAIGGITSKTAAGVQAAGADAVAMIGAIASSDEPASVLRIIGRL